MIEKSLFRDPNLRLEGQEDAPEKVPVSTCPRCRKNQELPALAHLCRAPDMLSFSRTDPSARG